jgi:hypothetical protein
MSQEDPLNPRNEMKLEHQKCRAGKAGNWTHRIGDHIEGVRVHCKAVSSRILSLRSLERERPEGRNDGGEDVVA